ncbi:hypothetical protein LINGRAHAP2_LOCUS20965, partial [Linum grandiflorum]
MANAIASMVVQRVFDGSISFHDNEIERRPYHRDCECALHESKGNCSNIWCVQRNISFRKKTRACSLAITASASSSNAIIPSRFSEMTSGLVSTTKDTGHQWSHRMY